MKYFFKKHYLAVAIAVLAGVATGLPQFVALKSPEFKGIYKTVNNDEIYYLARGQEIIDGHSQLTNPYLYEHKNEEPMQFWLPDYIMAKPLALLGVDVHTGYLFYDFLLPAILALLSYVLIFLLTESVWWSLGGAAFLHLKIFLFLFNRAPSPQLTFIFLLLVATSFLVLLKAPFQKKRLILAVIAFGLLFHIYPYYWAFSTAFLVLLACCYFFIDKKISWRLFLVLGGGLVIGIPYFISFYQSSKLPYYAESMARVGMIDSHFPSGLKIVVWASIFAVVFLLLKKWKIVELNYKTVFLAAGILGIVIVVNSHVITGKNLEFSSHFWPTALYWFIVSGLYLFYCWFKKWENNRFKTATAIFLALFVFVSSAENVYAVFRASSHLTETEISGQRYALILSWLRKNAPKESVVFANAKLSSLVPAYTSNNVFFAPAAKLFFVSDAEVEERFIIDNFWEKIDKDFVAREQRALWGSYYLNEFAHNQSKNKLRKLFGLEQKQYVFLPEKKVQDFVKRAEIIQKGSFENQLKKYKVDYFIWDKIENPSWLVSSLSFLTKVYENGNLMVYKIK